MERGPGCGTRARLWNAGEVAERGRGCGTQARFWNAGEVVECRQGCGTQFASITPKPAMLHSYLFVCFQIVLQAQPVNSLEDPTVQLEPLLSAMRKERYNYMKALHIWDVVLSNKEITALVYLISIPFSLMSFYLLIVLFCNSIQYSPNG